jgi:DNA-binding NtrC family response regulator
VKGRILVVDDEELICTLLERKLSKEGYEVTSTTDPEQGLTNLREAPFDVILTDLRMGSMDGLELLMRARKIRPECDVVIMTGFATVESARRSLTQGACDYITKPLDMDNELLPLLASLMEADSIAYSDSPGPASENIQPVESDFVGTGPESKRLLKRVLKVSRANIPVLLQGESGTGKERVAGLLHTQSNRASKPFVKLNCAALPDALLESELFGHARGAFTGAGSDRDGLFKAADGGTLLLDEIGEISKSFQVKLLRVLQEGEFHRLGDSKKTLRVDVRVIASTNRDLIKAVRAGDFREDLYYRLNVVPIDIPPLRERSADIPALVEHFLDRAQAKYRPSESISIPDGLVALLREYPWPGNIRELENGIASAVVLTETATLVLADLPPAVQEFARAQGVKPSSTEAACIEGQEQTLEDIEMKCILQAMNKTGYNRTRAANLLGVTRRTLSYRIGKYGLEADLDRLRAESDPPSDGLLPPAHDASKRNVHA